MTDIKAAMKAKDSGRLSVLRGVKTAFTNELVSKNRTPQDELSDDEATKVLMRLAKQRKDSIEQFEKGNRPELAEKETFELAVLQEYLPDLMSKDDIRAVAAKKKEELGITDPSRKGMLIGAVMKDVKGKAEGSLVKEVVEELFA